ncbi:MAG: hypothetical protein DHS20C13_30130 [Thermodesulfobacteriota bacterium]|nr:MAG: hypothetical protein DHS20C13_30130 [Thermodesulfobacteriota bacterium]
MTKIEVYSLAISAFGVLTIWIGFIFAFSQIRAAVRQVTVMVETHRENHELQRRLAAQSAVNNYGFSNISAELHNTFGYIKSNLPIPTEEINKKFSENDEHRVKLIMLLRHYESLARGINHGVYDEEIVKAALRRTMIRFARSFSLYIEESRTILSNPTLWIELTSLSEKWVAEDKKFQTRANTGDL